MKVDVQLVLVTLLKSLNNIKNKSCIFYTRLFYLLNKRFCDFITYNLKNKDYNKLYNKRKVEVSLMVKKTVIIGGAAGGATTAARLRRRDENMEIVRLEK